MLTREPCRRGRSPESATRRGWAYHPKPDLQERAEFPVISRRTKIDAARVPVSHSILLLLLIASLGGCSPERTTGGAESRRRNLILVSIDTLRADHLETYGYERKTAPNLARLAREGIVFEAARSQSSWTLPSLASIHTSLYPTQHGALTKEGALGDELVTISEVLRDSGYRTAAITSHFFADAQHGFAQGFGSFDETQVRGHGAVTSNEITDLGEEMLEDLAREDSDAPFFMWLHYFDSHYTYVRHATHDFVEDYDGPLGNRITAKRLSRMNRAGKVTPADIDYLIDLYDGEVAFQDDAIGRLLRSLGRLGLADDTVIVLTADHGEGLMDRDHFFHGHYVYDELIRVPLVIGGAIPEALRGLRIEGPIEVASIPATLAELAQVDAHGFRGPSLLEVARAGVLPRFAISEAISGEDDSKRRVAVVNGDWKLIHSLPADEYELFDLGSDPGERQNRFGDTGPGVAAVRDELVAGLARHREIEGFDGPTLELTEEQNRHLRELGYVY